MRINALCGIYNNEYYVFYYLSIICLGQGTLSESGYRALHWDCSVFKYFIRGEQAACDQGEERFAWLRGIKKLFPDLGN